jgi:hypothetical protein
MIKAIRIAALIILFINATGAIYGGFGLMYDPSGGFMQMPVTYLENSPFSNYLIPGIILFIVNGLFSVFVLFHVFRKHPNHNRLLVLQGILLSGWITVQIVMLGIFYPPMHLPFFLMGVFLMIAGFTVSSRTERV